MPLAFYVGQLRIDQEAASRITRKTGIVRSKLLRTAGHHGRDWLLRIVDPGDALRPISPTGFGADSPDAA